MAHLLVDFLYPRHVRSGIVSVHPHARLSTFHLIDEELQLVPVAQEKKMLPSEYGSLEWNKKLTSSTILLQNRLETYTLFQRAS